MGYLSLENLFKVEAITFLFEFCNVVRNFLLLFETSVEGKLRFDIDFLKSKTVFLFASPTISYELNDLPFKISQSVSI